MQDKFHVRDIVQNIEDSQVHSMYIINKDN